MPTDGIDPEDLSECWCCGGLTERLSLCDACEDAGCSRFGDVCLSDHEPADRVEGGGPG